MSRPVICRRTELKYSVFLHAAYAKHSSYNKKCRRKFHPDAASRQDNNLQLRNTVSSNRFHLGQSNTRRICAEEELR